MLLSGLVENFAVVPLLDDEIFDAVLEGFREAGFELFGLEEGQNVIALQREFELGTMNLLIDRRQQRVVGKLFYNHEGELEIIHRYLFTTREDGTVVPREHWFITFTESPSSKRKMSIRRITKVEDFEFRLLD